MRWLRLAIVPVYLALCVLLGGASAAGAWANMALQLLAVALIVWSLLAKRNAPMPRASTQLLAILGMVFTLVLIQMVPLPPSVWATLPGRAGIEQSFQLIDVPLPWLPISLAPYNTAASALALLPATAVVLGILRLGGYKNSWLAWAVIGVAAASVIVGALQLTGGVASAWYFYTITNRGFTTGFFANANHMATLLVITIPLIGSLYLDARRQSHLAQRSAALLVVLMGSVGVVLIGLVINTSLAGLGLAIPVVIATALMILKRNSTLPATWLIAAVPLAAGVILLMFTEPFGNNLTSSNASIDPESRYTSFMTSLRAMADFMPVGSGIGTFVEIYPWYEDFRSVSPTYMNHVHGDYIEVALEAGLPGLVLLAIFLAWWGSRVIAAWLSEDVDPYARAASIASTAILAHSVVDYPLRTAAISAVFAACCALMSNPRPFKHLRKGLPENKATHLSAD